MERQLQYFRDAHDTSLPFRAINSEWIRIHPRPGDIRGMFRAAGPRFPLGKKRRQIKQECGHFPPAGNAASTAINPSLLLLLLLLLLGVSAAFDCAVQLKRLT